MNRWIRIVHRWLGIGLVGLTLANMAAFALGQTLAWLIYLPLLPLFLLMFSGTWMFIQHHRRKQGA